MCTDIYQSIVLPSGEEEPIFDGASIPKSRCILIQIYIHTSQYVYYYCTIFYWPLYVI